MNAEKELEIQYKGGVLIAGSLLWDRSEIRTCWRNENFDIEKKVLINLPIRYGRISSTRNCTYTMVYSSECKSEEKIGKGYFIPFTQSMSVLEIISQSKKIVDAEHNEETELDRFNWGWGCLGLSINPDLENSDQNTFKVKQLKESWEKKYGSRFEPTDYKVDSEEPIMTKEGILKIDWQEELSNFDFAIGTATKPKIAKYPGSKKIAIKMIVNEDDEYFRENRNLLITTFQDGEIEKELSNDS